MSAAVAGDNEQRSAATVTAAAPSASSEHRLQSGWTFWYDKKLSGTEYAEEKRKNPEFHYRDNLKTLGSFQTVEDFWRYYVHLRRPANFRNDINLYLFREGEMPLWENYPAGGLWILKIKKGQGVIGKIWQDVLFAAIGELFEEPSLVGVALAMRSSVDMLSVWNRDNRNPKIRFNIGEKLRKVLALDPTTVIEYKFHQRSMMDRSTYTNTESFTFATKDDDETASRTSVASSQPKKRDGPKSSHRSGGSGHHHSHGGRRGPSHSRGGGGGGGGRRGGGRGGRQ